MRLRNYTVMVAVALIVTSGLAGLCAGDDTPIREDGAFPKDFLGGGDYVMAKAPSGDSWIAVVYGTGNQTVKSPITIVAMWNRTLAGAERHDSDGKLLNRSMPVNVRSILVHQYEALIEFNDSNGDGIGNIVRSPQPVAAGELIAREPVYKAVSLRQAWTRDTVQESTTMENGTLTKTFSFNLTATDLEYIVVGDKSLVNASPGDGKLNRITFGFHLKVFITRGVVSVPFYNLTWVGGPSGGISLTRVPDRTCNVTTYSARVKTDHTLEGWDLESQNTNPRVVLETGTRLGMRLSPSLMEYTNDTYLIKGLKGGGSMNYTTEGGKPANADSSTDTLKPDTGPADANDTPIKTGTNELTLADSWQRCGRFSWVSDVTTMENATATPGTGQAFFEVQGARKFNLDTDRGVYFGVLLLGGLSYPGAWKVVHDPEIGVEMGGVDIPYFGPPENHPPTARITSPPAGKQFKPSDTVKLDGSSCSDPDGDNISYVWMEGVKSLGTGAIVTKKFGEGTHRVSLTIHDGRGGFDTALVNFTVRKESTPGFGTAAAASAFLAAVVLAAVWRRRR